MADRTDLEAAAAAGVISDQQVGPLYEFLSARGAQAVQAPSGEEELRFIRNFHDVFLAIGILLFAIGLAIGIGTYVASSPSPEQGTVTTGLLCGASVALMWALGELFARRRRLFLPAIAIVCAMTLFAVIAAAALYAGVLLGRDFGGNTTNLETMPPELRNGILLAVSFAVLTPLAFYARFRLPFSLGLAGGGAAMFVIVTCMALNFDLTVQMLPALMFLLGGLLFLAGVGFDARDPQRKTRFSDNGFWLHFAAAPLILNGAFGLIGQMLGAEQVISGSAGMIVAVGDGEQGAAAIQASATLVVVLVLGIISLLINRRALIVSALLTTGVAIGVLMNAAGLGAGALGAATLITLGAFVLILGAGWHSVRRALLGWVKPDGLWARIFPPEAPAAA